MSVSGSTTLHQVTEAELVAAFTEWERRYREEPEQFLSDFKRFTESAESYGESCGPYLLELLAELGGPK